MPEPDQAATTAAQQDAATATTDAQVDQTSADTLGANGKAALDAERKARRDAEKAARDAQAKVKQLEDAQLSETEKLKKQAEEGQRLAEQATNKLRQANLRDALAEVGFSGPQAKAVARLIDGVEYDDGDEPTNLKARLEAAAGEYGDLVKPGATDSTTFDGGARTNAPPTGTAEEQHQQLVAALLSGRPTAPSH